MSALGLLLAGALALPPFTIQYRGEWLLFSREGRFLQTLDNFGNQQPTGVTVAPNGAAFAFTTKDGLFYGKDLTTPPIRIGPGDGYFTDPKFDPSGDFIYFAHAAGPKAGPIGAHGSGVNAQLWKVSIGDGVATQLTDSHGCKRHPDPQPDGSIYLIHSTCDGASAIELLADKTTTVVPAGAESLEIRVSPNTMQLAWINLLLNGADLIVAANHTPIAPRKLVRLTGTYDRLNIAWSNDSKHIFYQSEGRLWRIPLSGGKPKPIFDLQSKRAVQ